MCMYNGVYLDLNSTIACHCDDDFVVVEVVVVVVVAAFAVSVTSVSYSPPLLNGCYFFCFIFILVPFISGRPTPSQY